jgi:hypothetical protein
VAGETRKEKEKRAQKDDERRAAKRKEADLPGMIMQARTRDTSSLHQPRPAVHSPPAGAFTRPRLGRACTDATAPNSARLLPIGAAD